MDKIKHIIKIAESKGFNISNHHSSSGPAWSRSDIIIFEKNGEQDYTLRYEYNINENAPKYYKNVDEYYNKALEYLKKLEPVI